MSKFLACEYDFFYLRNFFSEKALIFNTHFKCWFPVCMLVFLLFLKIEYFSISELKCLFFMNMMIYLLRLNSTYFFDK